MKKILLLFTVLLSYTVSAQMFVPANGTAGQRLIYANKYNLVWSDTTTIDGTMTQTGSTVGVDTAANKIATKYDLQGISSPSLYTASGTVPTLVTATLTDSLTFSGGVNFFKNPSGAALSVRASGSTSCFTIERAVPHASNKVLTVTETGSSPTITLGGGGGPYGTIVGGPTNIQWNPSNTGRMYFTVTDAQFFQFYYGATGYHRFYKDRVGIGTTSPAASTMLHVKGSGATSATTTALFENSSGVDALEILDDGNSIFSGIVDINPSGSGYHFNIEQPDGTQGFKFHTSDTWSILEMGGNTGATAISFNTLNDSYINGGGGFVIGATSTSAQFEVNGAGTGTGVTALFQDSGGADLFKIQDNGNITSGANENVTNNVKVTISSAQILALNTTPIEVVPAPPSGYAIRVISASGKMNFLTAAYATSTTIGLCTATATLCQLTSANLLGSATSIIQRISNEVTGVGTQLVDNQALTVTSLIADPTAGSGTLDLYITYELIKL